MQPTRQKLAFVFELCETKGHYPLERMLILYNLLEEPEKFLFIKSNNHYSDRLCKAYHITPVYYDKIDEVAKAIRNLQIDTIIQDGKNISHENALKLKPFCRTYIQFDNFLDGHLLADYNLFTYTDELVDFNAPYALVGSHCFAVPEAFEQLRQPPMNEPFDIPHIVVYFEDGDPYNLTFRTIRHLMQLHIPVHITVLIDDEYPHDTDDLQMMLLSRKNTKLIRNNLQPIQNATIVIGNANYTPFKIASLNIPYIALAQNEHELGNSCVKEEHGFIHLGLGRKIKQSMLQNAVMELLLHEERRARAIKRQHALKIHQNNELLQSLLYELMNGQPKLTFL